MIKSLHTLTMLSKLKSTVLLVLLFCLTLTSQAQLTINNFNGTTACPTNNGNVFSAVVNATTIPFTRSTMTCNTTLNIFNSTTLNNTANRNDNSYIEFSITADAGYSLNLTDLAFLRQASGTAPNSLIVSYSTDPVAANFNSTRVDMGVSTTPTSGTTLTWTFSSPIITGSGGKVTFRFYTLGTTRADNAVGTASSTGTFRVDNVSLSGSVIAVSPPAITSSATASSNYGTASTYTITASNLPSSYDATLNPSGALPTGFSIAGNTLSIAATTPAGVYSILTSATNGAGTGSQVLTYTVNTVTPTISVTGPAIFNFTGGPIGPTTYSAPAVGGGAAPTGTVTFTYEGIGATVYTQSTIAPSAVGTYKAVATIAADGNYNAATSADFPFEINQLLDQTIVFNALPNKTFGDAVFVLSAADSGASGNPVTFVSSDPTIVFLSGTNNATATILKTGTVNITASQAGNASYNAATNVVQPLTIDTLLISVTGITAANKVYNGSPNTTVSGGTLVGVLSGDVANVTLVQGTNGTFADPNANTGIVVTASGYSLTGSKAGNYKINQPTTTADITQASQTITFNTLSVKTPLYAPATLTATASSGLAVSYSSDLPLIADVVGNVLTCYSVGTAIITASQAGNQNYLPATSVSQNQVVAVPATKLVFTAVQPLGIVSTNLPTVAVQALRADNSVDTNFINTVTISKNSGPGTLTGTLTFNGINGSAFFNSIQNDQTGVITLEATAVGLTSATSSSITINQKAVVTDVILPQYAITGGTTANRLQYVCRLKIDNLTPNTTYRYFTGSDTSANFSGTSAGNFIAINNTGGLNGHIVGYTSSKSLNGTELSGDVFSSSNGYARLTTDATGSYTGWFSIVPSGNAIFNAGNNNYIYVQLNNGLDSTTIFQTVRSSATFNLLSTTNGRAIRGVSNASSENPIFLYNDTAGTSRPLYGTWAENDGISTNFTTWYGTVEGVTGSWGAYIPTALPNGVQRIEQRNIVTGAIEGCPAIDADTNGIWPSGVNTTNPTGGTTPLVITLTDAALDCPVLNTITTGTIAPLVFCADNFNGAAVSVPFTSTDVFNATNVYTAQLSDATGSFSSPVNIGTVTSTLNTDVISAIIPAGTPAGSGYRIRVRSSAPNVIGTPNADDIQVTIGQLYYADVDGDTYGNSSSTVFACTAPLSYVSVGGDCNDLNNTAYPGATEVCDDIDNDCDALIDEGVKITFYQDLDGDTYGSMTVTTQACIAPFGYVSDNTDCNDFSNAAFPGNTEICDGIDNNCDLTIDEGCAIYTFFRDFDGDTYGDVNNDTTIAVNVAPSGYVTNNTDCDDNNINVNPGITEVCNYIDDNCVNGIDELLQVIYYEDADNDTYGNAFVNQMACTQPANYVLDFNDCDDTNNNINPSKTELCGNGIDDNCDFQIDETTLAINVANTPIVCFGGSSTVTVTSTGGVAPITGTGTFTQVAGAVIYTVTDAAGCSSSNTLTLTQPDEIVVTSFSPLTVNPPTTLTITGAGFTGATAVLINGVSATFIVNSNTQISVTVPIGATDGPVTVVKGACQGVSASNLKIISITEIILPQYAVNGGTAASRLPYVCRLQLNNLNPNSTYRYVTNTATSSAGTMYVINNVSTPGGEYITGHSSLKALNTSLMANNEFTTGSRYGELTTDANGNYTGWFSLVPSGNAVFNPGVTFRFNVTLNNGAGGTTTSLTLNTTSSITMIAPSAGANSGRAVKGSSNASAENMIFLYDNTAGTGRPIAGTWAENDGITTTYTTWYTSGVDGVAGAWGTYIPSITNGIQRIEQRDVATGVVTGCPAIDADGVWPNAGTTVSVAGGTASPIAFTMNDAPLVAQPVSVSISTPSVNVCAGNSVTFTATPTYGGVTPTYQWKVNGNNEGTNSSTFTTTTLADNDVVTCELTSSNTCVTGSPATSNALTITVRQPSSSSTSITACDSYIWNGTTYTTSGTYTFVTPNAVGCDSTATLNLTINNSSTSSTSITACNSYLWNGTTYTSSGTYTYVTPNAVGCDSTATLILTITTPVTPTITITAAPGNVITTGTSVTFSSSITNGGLTPAYQWLKNGLPVGTNNASYTDAALANGDLIACILTSNETCVTTSIDTSNEITMVVNSTVTLNLTMFIQGFYQGSNTMTPALNNVGNSTNPLDVDDVTVELHEITGTFDLAHTATGVLKVDGTLQVTFPSTVNGNSYYIVIKHRNTIETWSKDPVPFSSTTSFNFAN